MIKLLGYAVAVLVAIAVVLCLPFAVIWMINVFGESLWPSRAVPYTLDTWLAACILTGLFATGINARRK